MKRVVQEEKTGCAIASSAAIAGVSYKEARKISHSIGMYAEDSNLWSETNFIRKLIKKFGIKTGKKEIPFTGWESLPNCALLVIKWHIERGKPHWHWVVFVREGGKLCPGFEENFKNKHQNRFWSNETKMAHRSNCLIGLLSIRFYSSKFSEVGF